MGAAIATSASRQTIIQPKPIGEIRSGGEGFPFTSIDITDMAITGLARVSGNKLLVVPYDPEYIVNDAQTGGAGSRLLQNLIIVGKISEFDQNVDAEESGVKAGVVAKHGKPTAKVGMNAGRARKTWRISLNLYLLDYKTHVVIPGTTVSNTINVAETGNNQELSFVIFGSGLGVNGSISDKQGLHWAARNLVDYSLLQLLSRYYDIPYEPLLDIQKTDAKTRP